MAPAPVFLPGEFRGQRSLAGCSLWGNKELDMTEQLSMHTNKLFRKEVCSQDLS